ncbi:hypothetical protein MMC07_000097 [Pseudocyphellaria aurata]|nr:hypothetical protein [Pseudocyphellaria aurata]
MPESDSSDGAPNLPARGGPGGPIRHSRSRRHGSPYAGFSSRRDRNNSNRNTHGGESGPIASPHPSDASSSGNSRGAGSTSEFPPQPSPTAVRMISTLAHRPSLTTGNSHLTGPESDIDNPHISRARPDNDEGFGEWLARNARRSGLFFEVRPITSRLLEEQMFSRRREGVGRSQSESGLELDHLRLPNPFEEDQASGRRPVDFETVDTIMASLPPVETDSLGEREQSCPVCLNDYNRPGSATSSSGPSETEHAVRLRCHHVIGRECIRYWLQDGNITCPLCRANVHGP